MEAEGSKQEKGKDAGRGRKKRRGGTKFTAPKNLRRSAQRRKDAQDLFDDDGDLNREYTVEEFERGRYRKVPKMRSLNLDAITETGEEVEEGDSLDWNDGDEEGDSRRQSDHQEGHDPYEKVVSYVGHMSLL